MKIMGGKMISSGSSLSRVCFLEAISVYFLGQIRLSGGNVVGLWNRLLLRIKIVACRCVVLLKTTELVWLVAIKDSSGLKLCKRSTTLPMFWFSNTEIGVIGLTRVQQYADLSWRGTAVQSTATPCFWLRIRYLNPSRPHPRTKPHTR